MPISFRQHSKTVHFHEIRRIFFNNAGPESVPTHSQENSTETLRASDPYFYKKQFEIDQGRNNQESLFRGTDWTEKRNDLEKLQMPLEHVMKPNELLRAVLQQWNIDGLSTVLALGNLQSQTNIDFRKEIQAGQKIRLTKNADGKFLISIGSKYTNLSLFPEFFYGKEKKQMPPVPERLEALKATLPSFSPVEIPVVEKKKTPAGVTVTSEEPLPNSPQTEAPLIDKIDPVLDSTPYMKTVSVKPNSDVIPASSVKADATEIPEESIPPLPDSEPEKIIVPTSTDAEENSGIRLGESKAKTPTETMTFGEMNDAYPQDKNSTSPDDKSEYYFAPEMRSEENTMSFDKMVSSYRNDSEVITPPFEDSINISDFSSLENEIKSLKDTLEWIASEIFIKKNEKRAAEENKDSERIEKLEREISDLERQLTSIENRLEKVKTEHAFFDPETGKKYPSVSHKKFTVGFETQQSFDYIPMRDGNYSFEELIPSKYRDNTEFVLKRGNMDEGIRIAYFKNAWRSIDPIRDRGEKPLIVNSAKILIQRITPLSSQSQEEINRIEKEQSSVQ